MSAEAVRSVTPEEYLAAERRAELKSEYLDGCIYAMAGASPEHALITNNFGAALSRRVAPRGCRTYAPDLRVHVKATGLYAYPDVTVVCGEPEWLSADLETLLNPTLIVEVLSPSTEDFDRGRKWLHYQSIESLQDYVLVSQSEARVERYTREPDGSWNFSCAIGMDASISLRGLGCDVPLSEIYTLTRVAEAGG